MRLAIAGYGCLALLLAAADPSQADETPRFSRHVVAVFTRAGCNGGTCHGAVQGKNGFRLSLFGAKPDEDFEQVVRQAGGRRVNLQEPEQSLLLLKAAGQVPHGGGRRVLAGSVEDRILRDWLAAGALQDDPSQSKLVSLAVTPNQRSGQSGESYPLSVAAVFADGTREEVTALSSYSSLDSGVAEVNAAGVVQTTGVGDTAVVVRYRDQPAISQTVVSASGSAPFPAIEPHNFIDEHVLAKLRQLNIPSADLADDATFLRRLRLDVTGQLPTPAEVREFLSDSDPNKRMRKIDQLLSEPGYAALWTLKFCDLLAATDYGVYADGLAEHYEAPRFQAWVRARLEENTPYDEFAARILTATSRDGRSLEVWGEEVVALQEGYKSPRQDLKIYARRQTLDAYWQRKEAVGVPGTLQIAHAFLGLRLECAQCHRHPHDVWQQDDLLSFANFFMGVRTVGFQGDNEKRYPAEHVLFKKYEQQGKALAEEAKQLKEGKAKELAEQAQKAQQELNRLRNEKQGDSDAAKALQKTIDENEALRQEIQSMEQRARQLSDEIPKRILHAQILYETKEDKAKRFASVTSPLGTQSSEVFRLPGETQPVEVAAGEDPRGKVVEWLRRPDNPFFAKAIVNRIWAHYFGRGIVNPPDDLSPYNPPTHPELLDELCRGFIENRYDLKWLHRAILTSRTYQQASGATAESALDRANYAHFYLRRLPAEVLLDTLNAATGTRENFDMRYYHWPDGLSTVEVPYIPRQNGFVTFMLEQFGRPPRNSSVQCDCARQSEASLLQVMTFANHPKIWQKVADPAGLAARVGKEIAAPREQVEELYLATLSRLPEQSELDSCLQYLAAAESPEKGLQAVLWSLINTREFVLQH
jgi:hypothetical protein